ncbi:CRISPR-associated endonuclease Cas2 [Laspinema sp. D1]|uniref:CRISPR-associated endonuclease Cas2 n=1 Tax=Laspinema palackyanum D2a TaxID=2953684 RepID=A0ABT2MRV7_9CYAN|nr:CRISPR-associated endonuclease Cas2 [Laspinema sp. D2b]MCT7966646.1 CRISPR-associated endonuclease Cas2 [Laspinema sp. D2a]
MLQGYGERIPYSMFRCWLNQQAREKLRWELEQVLAEEDSLLLIRLPNPCLQGLASYKHLASWPLPKESHRVI